MLIDSHTHIYLDDFEEDLDTVMSTARNQGVGGFMMPNIDASSIASMHAVADKYPDVAYPMMGLHPCSVKDNYKEELSVIEKHLFTPIRKYWAVGEIGIDLYWDKSTLDIQKEVFMIQVEWAKALNLPVVIHVRESFNETLALMDQLMDDRLRGVFHCFGGTLEQAKHIVEYETFKMGIGGVLTFKNGKIDQFISKIDLSHLILETDAPYLAPVPHRGKRNEPSYVRLVADKLASLYGVSVAEIERRTTENCIELFQLNHE